MKKTKKFEDGGATGGRFVDMGESRVFVPDTPAAATMGPIPSGMGSDIGRPDVVSRQLGPMSGGIGAGIGGLQDAAGRTETLMPFVAGNNEPSRLPIGQIMPPRGRGIGGSLAGQLAASGMGGMAAGSVSRGLVWYLCRQCE